MGAPQAVLSLLVVLSLVFCASNAFALLDHYSQLLPSLAWEMGARRIHTTFRDKQRQAGAQKCSCCLSAVPAAGVQLRGAGADCRAVCEARRAVHQRRGVRVAGLRREAAHPHGYGAGPGCSGQGMGIDLTG